MQEQLVRLETYSGYKADERPVRLHLGERVLEVAAVEDRWYSPGATYFRVLTADGDCYVLRHDNGQDAWSLTAYTSRKVIAATSPGSGPAQSACER